MRRHSETDMLQLQCNAANLPKDIEKIVDVRMLRSNYGSQKEEKIALVSRGTGM